MMRDTVLSVAPKGLDQVGFKSGNKIEEFFGQKNLIVATKRSFVKDLFLNQIFWPSSSSSDSGFLANDQCYKTF